MGQYHSSEISPLRTDERRLEHGLRAAETLVSDGDDLTVGQLVALLQGGGGGGGGHLVLKIQSHVAQLLLDVTHDLALSWERDQIGVVSIKCASLCQNMWR